MPWGQGYEKPAMGTWLGVAQLQGHPCPGSALEKVMRVQQCLGGVTEGLSAMAGSGGLLC